MADPDDSVSTAETTGVVRPRGDAPAPAGPLVLPVYPVLAPEDIGALILQELRSLRVPGGRGEAAAIRRVLWHPRSGMVADESRRFSGLDEIGRPLVVGFLGGDPDPGNVGRGAENSCAAAEVLGADLGPVALRPLAVLDVAGRPCAVYPWRRPLHGGLRGRAERRLLRPAVLRWLRRVAAQPMAPASGREPIEAFADRLEHIRARDGVSEPVRRGAARALQRLTQGAWLPRHQLDHNDVHAANILLNRDRRGRIAGDWPFVLIDWPGANVAGYGMYDLVRCAGAFGLGPAGLRREVLAHCVALRCEPADAPGHLLAALGHIGMNLGEFPEERYLAAVERCRHALDATGVAP